jgi:hypothetical protein
MYGIHISYCGDGLEDTQRGPQSGPWAGGSHHTSSNQNDPGIWQTTSMKFQRSQNPQRNKETTNSLCTGAVGSLGTFEKTALTSPMNKKTNAGGDRTDAQTMSGSQWEERMDMAVMQQ